jgi:threonine dehydrogenase-like Zn-dependent dehydrogenase
VLVEGVAVGVCGTDIATMAVAAGGVVCFTGVGSGGITSRAAVADIAAAAVLKNNAVVGSVNANKRHWYKAGEALARADRTWLEGLITRREEPEKFKQALERKSDDIKVVIQFSDI